jgi:hypothetical protein
MATIASRTFTNNLTEETDLSIQKIIQASEKQRSEYQTRSIKTSNYWAPDFDQVDKKSEGYLRITCSNFDARKFMAKDQVHVYKIAAKGWSRIFAMISNKNPNRWGKVIEYLNDREPDYVLDYAYSLGEFLLNADEVKELQDIDSFISTK